MGACATKPKADATDSPAPLPEVEKKELTVTGTVIETKEIVDADKSRSLSNLFKESEDVKDSTENDKTEPEVVKQEACEAKENTDISKSYTTEVVNSDMLVKTILTAPAVEAKNTHEVEADTEKTEIPVEKSVTPVADALAKTEAEDSIDVKTVALEDETLEGNASSSIIYTPVEVEVDNEIEVRSSTEIKEMVACDDEKIEEQHNAIETPLSESTEVESASDKTEKIEEQTITPVVFASVKVEEDKETEVAVADEIQKNEEHDKVVETHIESPKSIAEERKQASELEEPAILLDEKSVEDKKCVEIQEPKIEEEKTTVTETKKAIEDKTAETEVCAENVKP